MRPDSTKDGEEGLRDAVAQTAARCPVYNVISDASVKVETAWIRRPDGTA